MVDIADIEKSALGPVYPPSPRVVAEAHVKSMEEYRKMYDRSINDPVAFWGDIAKQFYWKGAPEGRVFDYNFSKSNGRIFIKFMEGIKTNVCYNVIDRNIENGLGDNVAFYWEGNEPGDDSKVTYSELKRRVCQFANVLKAKGVKKGDHVAIYMPMILELPIAVLACARIGAPHSVVFGGFSAESLVDRILDSKCCLLVTADGLYRGKKLIELKSIADQAFQILKDRNYSLKCCIVVRHLLEDLDKKGPQEPPKRPSNIGWNEELDCWWHEEVANVSDECEPEWLDAEDPLFLLYTSGSTGKPKGVVHTQAGYLLYAATTFKYSFDYHHGDVYFCTADVGWITGHSYVVYGPLANGAPSIVFEGLPVYPDAGRYWDIVDKYKVSKFYTAPTAIRSLMRFGPDYVKKYSRKTLKVLGSVGEPLNPEAWRFYYEVIGNGECSISDTFWQTETGGHVLTPLPGCTPMKPGSVCFPFFGIKPVVLNEDGNEVQGQSEGYLAISQAWPSTMRTVYGDHERYENTYFGKFDGYYCTGDGCFRDKDGYFWITGRIDDCINVSGHLTSTAQVESALIEHDLVAEAAVVSYPHEIKGQCLYAFLTLIKGAEFSDEVVVQLKQQVRQKIGSIAVPDYIQDAPGLPKTRSGKIMRRVLRKIARNDHQLGDISTMADSSIIETLFQLRPASLK
ncbi:uncharacterized protein TRIADDRAFT_27464 [Trichoplax adhaerens]|uniref:Acetyl-coenzyme A synthetase n=1 Tax=Trichoplax adhaerens TaxID=10228 RepID=B3S2N4_TRIAD|nr:hypothetical protein TRIADDRAFT_27464 [Trichoplax adhaerens]EDV23448.1 hypothetical protein TRIADDRAFT_27464 [Trichoplax adhaerens]|eukprot:XP_002114358.1 hypothetical protein TRIADDRAFT_27464 [Trichoplax adhaerens]